MIRRPDERLPVTVDCHLAYRGQVVSVRVDTERLPDGTETARETVIHAGGVVVAALDEQERVVLVRRYRPAVGERLLELPAGVCNPGADPEVAAEHALLRQTGLSAHRWDSLGSFFSAPAVLTERIHAFLARDLSQDGPGPQPHEDITLLRVQLRDLLADPASVCDARALATLPLVTAQLARDETEPAPEPGCGCCGPGG